MHITGRLRKKRSDLMAKIPQCGVNQKDTIA
jgi:hypothetical protein